MACTTLPSNHTDTIAQQAKKLGAYPEALQTPYYTLQTLQMTTHQSKTLRAYIEGDGRAWASLTRPSSDPTPQDFLVIDLMALDPTPDKVYIARPCQFIKTNQCSVNTWTMQRYSKQAVTALNDALDKLKKKWGYQSFELIGFSGGATLALLSAAHRQDVISVRTVAGNLTPSYVNTFHNVSPMPEALNPVDYAKALSNIPQLHFYGTRDSVIPPHVYSTYKASFSKQDCIHGLSIAGATHMKGWRKQWTELLGHSLPSCSTNKSKHP